MVPGHFRVEETHLKRLPGKDVWGADLVLGCCGRTSLRGGMPRPTGSETRPGSPARSTSRGPGRGPGLLPRTRTGHSQTSPVLCFSSGSRSLCAAGVLEWRVAGAALTSAAEREFSGGTCPGPRSRLGAGEMDLKNQNAGAPGVRVASEHGCWNE